ncbi:MAG: hypothetical protein MZV70_55505 [Desulfobacterales bacterium]|nr:hypothetical protein [Desulfobacterales bacterium]
MTDRDAHPMRQRPAGANALRAGRSRCAVPAARGLRRRRRRPGTAAPRRPGRRASRSSTSGAIRRFTRLGCAASSPQKLGNDAVERRGIIDLESNYPGFLRGPPARAGRAQPPAEPPAGERVDHDVIRLMYRYARSKERPVRPGRARASTARPAGRSSSACASRRTTPAWSRPLRAKHGPPAGRRRAGRAAARWSGARRATRCWSPSCPTSSATPCTTSPSTSPRTCSGGSPPSRPRPRRNPGKSSTREVGILTVCAAAGRGGMRLCYGCGAYEHATRPTHVSLRRRFSTCPPRAPDRPVLGLAPLLPAPSGPHRRGPPAVVQLPPEAGQPGDPERRQPQGRQPGGNRPARRRSERRRPEHERAEHGRPPGGRFEQREPAAGRDARRRPARGQPEPGGLDRRGPDPRQSDHGQPQPGRDGGASCGMPISFEPTSRGPISPAPTCGGPTCARRT